MNSDAGSRQPRFRFYEVVTIRDTARTREQGIAGRKGAILGIAPPEDPTQSATYAVVLYDAEITWTVAERDLVATGEMDRRETFYDGESIRVDRAGEIVDD